MSPRRPKHRVKAGRRRFPHGTSRYCQVAVRPKRAVGNRSVEGAEPLGRRKLRRIDLKAWPLVTALGRNYIKPTRGPGGLHLLPFPHRARVASTTLCTKSGSAAELRSAAATLAHANEVTGDL
jgi:hypothetical protein